MSRVFGVTIMLLAAVLVRALPAAADDTGCVSTEQQPRHGGFDDVVVPAGQTCVLSSAFVSGNVIVEQGATLRMIGTNTVKGNVEAKGAQAIAISGMTAVLGNLKVEESQSVTSASPVTSAPTALAICTANVPTLGRTEDGDVLAGTDAADIEHALQGGEPEIGTVVLGGHRGREVGRRVHELAFQCGDVAGERAPRNPEHVVVRREPRGGGADLDHPARDVAARHLLASDGGPVAYEPHQIRGSGSAGSRPHRPALALHRS